MPTMTHPSLSFKSRLLAALPRDEYARLQRHLEPVHLPKGKTLYHVGDSMRYAYFMLGGMVSYLSITEEGSTVEVAMVGDEGMVGVPVILKGFNSPYQVLMQLPGNAMRLRADVLAEEFNRRGALHDLLLRYTYTLLTQITQSAACNRFHSSEQRLCRWLLIGQDRVHSDILHLTQEFLSHMLGSPRTKVTEIAGNLQRDHLISYSRGRIQILDRSGLEKSSCECYRLVSDNISHFLAA